MTDNERAGAQSPERCKGHAGVECPFGNNPPLVDFGGHSYCIYHLPLDVPEKPKKPQQYQNLLDKHRDNNLSGVQFPAGSYQVHAIESIGVLEHCKFADKIELQLSSGTFSFDHSEFLGSVVLRSESAKVTLRGVTFIGKLTMQANNSRTARCWAIEGSTFRAEVDFSKACFDDTLSLNGSTFSAPVWLGGASFPQQTTAHGTRFEAGALVKECEGSYRAARSAFATHRNREIEGTFYALEKRCHREAIGWNWRNWIPRGFSAIYDWSSAYGQSYERALLWFFGVQFTFGVIYAGLAGSLSLGGRFDSRVVLFTVASLVKPFELLGGRAPESKGIYSLLPKDGDITAWAVATAAHSLLSLVLVAMFLFALSWRFKRE